MYTLKPKSNLTMYQRMQNTIKIIPYLFKSRKQTKIFFKLVSQVCSCHVSPFSNC